MAWLHALQLALALTVLGVIARSMRRLAYEAAIDTEIFLSAIEPALEHGQLDLAAEIANDCRPAWGADLAAQAVEALRERAHAREVRRRVDELRFELEQRAGADLPALHTLGRMAPPLAFVGVIVELGTGLAGGHGLLALQRGAAESLTLGNALFTFSLGLGTAVVAFFGLVLLRRRARDTRAGLGRVARAIERALSGGAEM